MPTFRHLQACLWRRRQQRIRQHRRCGTGFPDPGLIVKPGTGIAPPVTVAQGGRPVTLVFDVEFNGDPLYPQGTLLLISDRVWLFANDNGLLTLATPADFSQSFLQVDLSDTTTPGGGQPPSGRHTICIFLGARDTGDLRTGLFVDGDQVANGIMNISWADLGSWEYMNAVTGVGKIGDLHIFPDFIPPAFVG